MTPLDDLSKLPVHDIMCIDCKSFYASTEAIRRGEFPLAAKIAVMSNEESNGGLILAASPKTKKKYGVKLGTRRYEIKDEMDIEMVEPRMADYIKRNYQINQIYRAYTDDQHWYPYSVDESFIDVTHSHALFGTNEEIAAKIQQEVFDQTGIITTVGIGQNPLLAKLALDNEAKYEEPWRAYWTYEHVPETIWEIGSLTDFWSIGERTAKKLNALGINSINELAHFDRKKLHQKFGVLGDALYFNAWGIDYSDLKRRYVPCEENKGYGNSQILMRDYNNLTEIETVLSEIADQVGTRLREHHVQGEVVGISVGFAQPDDQGKDGFSAQTHIDPTDRTDQLTQAVRYLFEKKWQGNTLRNLGVRVNRISKMNTLQMNLFESNEKFEAKRQLDQTIDHIRDRFGYKSLIHAYSKTEGATAISRSGLVGGHHG
ncbi:Y-family DNA polymerase [Lapidilactobacillus mulanensis]|uniref:Y-family DNA polymerase n=1 Tax=Lapidilactobacillus mulanensis TaxID=2485999 RepID=A0ABW4DNW4_9LACO|nr:Y-family DNA polymerase [Lapidilactobacillus mulanensis]